MSELPPASCWGAAAIVEGLGAGAGAIGEGGVNTGRGPGMGI